MSVGKRIREIRRAKDLSQDSLAESIGITAAYISRIENEIADPDSELIVKFAKALDVSPADLFDEDGSKLRPRVKEPSVHYSRPGPVSERQQKRIDAAVRMLEDDELFDIFSLLERLPQDKRSAVRQFLNAILKA